MLDFIKIEQQVQELKGDDTRTQCSNLITIESSIF
jgi:hypothetical protein